MRQVKLFKGVEAEVSRLEETINNWIRESGAHVVQINGTIAPQNFSSPSDRPLSGSDLFVLVEYETRE